MRYFFALWLVVSSLAWAAFGSKGVQAVASSSLRPHGASARKMRAVPPLPRPPKRFATSASAPADDVAYAQVHGGDVSDAPKPGGTGSGDAQAIRAKINHRAAAELVVVVSIDGLRPDVITPSFKSLHRLFLQGSSARIARTIDKSATLPSHASMVSGVDSDEHGLDFNAYRPERGNIARPTMFSVAHAAGVPTYMFVGKSKLKHLLAKPTDAELKITGGGCKKVIKDALPQLQKMKRGLVFMHFADPDAAGHRNGWMSNIYVDAAHEADECVQEVMDTIEHGSNPSRTLLLVTSDHGGHGRSHGTRMEVDQRIPWFAWGPSVRRGRTRHDVHTTDTAATALTALGLKPPEHIQGKPVGEAVGAAGVGPVGMPLVGSPIEHE